MRRAERRAAGACCTRSLSAGAQIWHARAMAEEPDRAREALRRRIFGGARLLIDSLSDAELEAAHALIRDGEAEIINEACKPFLVRVLAP